MIADHANMKCILLPVPVTGKVVHYLLLLLAVILFSLKGFSQTCPYKFDYLTVDEGLSHTDANDIAQDPLGYIWIATHFGLDRYDGYTIKKFYNDNSPLKNAFKNRLRCVFPDKTGNIWLGTEAGLQCFNAKTEKYLDFKEATTTPGASFTELYKPAGELLYGLADGRLKIFLFSHNELRKQDLDIPKELYFRDMAADKEGTLFFATNEGLWTLDSEKHLKKCLIVGFPDQEIDHLYFDHDTHLLISTSEKILRLARHAGSDLRSPLPYFEIIGQLSAQKGMVFKDFIQDEKSDYWVNSGAGLMRLDSNLRLIQIVDDKTAVGGLNSNALSRIFIDRSGCLWVGTFGGGVNYCDLNEKLFYTFQHNPEISNSLLNNHIRAVMAEGKNVWIGTTSKGLNRYDLKTRQFTFYNTVSKPIRLKNDVIAALSGDNERNIWIGTGNGIEILKADFKTLIHPSGSEHFPTYNIETLAKDIFGNMWFGNHLNQFGVIRKDQHNYFHVKYYGEGFSILADKNKPQIFVSSTEGLKRMIIDDQGNIVKTIHYTASTDSNSLSSNYTYPVCKQNDSTFWIGTIGGGLNRLSLHSETDTYTVKTFGDRFGVFKDVESLEIDNAGNLWMGGNGLECLNPQTGKLVRYDKNDGLQGNSFKVGASFKDEEGRLYFGGINGLNYFYPEQIRSNNIPAKPVLTDILINNQHPLITESKTSGISEDHPSHSISYCKDLKLDYKQNNFEIFFSSMHFANPLKCRYRYKLVGFDKDWKYTDGRNPSASYNNLDFAHYHFVLEATNNDGIWSRNTAEANITITPPLWKSDMAKILYVLLIFSALAGIYIYQARWYRLKREIGVREVNERRKEEMHKQKEELYQQQLQFFTNVSHEFRTPLTLILGPLENLINQNRNSVLNDSYQLMLRNAKRLVNLISELMNFKKVADSVIKLQVQPLVVSRFSADLAREFQNIAVSKDIEFKFTDHTRTNLPGSPEGYFDLQILEKILFNLLSNSFKYTNVGGAISFDVFFDKMIFKPAFDNGFELLNPDYRANKYVYFRVADSGIGISRESISRIFDRYYRVSKNHLGSGVGLALVKSLTQLHKGDIYVYSERYKGTEIIIGIPWGDENFLVSERALPGTGREMTLEPIDKTILSPLVTEPEKQVVISKIQKHILLVDDNQELRLFLKQIFEKYYYIYEAEDGLSAIEIAVEKVPDLIISDVMMPGMSGIEFCKTVKGRFETSHIPIIILSAKDALDTKLEGMESGADFYFAKPVSVDLLLLTVQNLFEQGEKLKQRYTQNYLAEATELVHSSKDKEFFQQILKIIEDNIEEGDLDVDFLCKHLCISRTKLYQKIKSISDQSVGEFIRTIRLKKAIQIMTHEDITMNEVADRIGLQSSSNFCRAFKKEYGKSPLQFIQSLRNS
jgi:signal transduction histidine kinase/ligand-binding sensor domain-containing protein/DNA-binding response OmpR family regulator